MTLTLSADSIRPVASLFRRLKIRATLPILDHIRLTVAEGEAEAVLETNDLDIHLAVRVPIAGPTTPGSFTIPRPEFFTIARLADKGGNVRFDATPPKKKEKSYPVSIIFPAKTLRSDRTVTGLLPGDFPPSPEIQGDRVIFPSTALEAIRRVRPAASDDETRLVLNGVFLTPEYGGHVVATDGRRLATVATRVPCAESVIPNAVADLLLDPACASAAIWCRQDSLASLAFGKTRLSFRCIDGNYPNYRQVIPASFTSSCTFPAAIVPAVIAWLKPNRKESVTISFGENEARMKTGKPGEQTNATTVPALVTGPAPEQIAFNASFLIDALEMDLHTIDMNTGREPGVLTDGPTRYVLMPMRASADPAPEETADSAPPAETEVPQESPTEEPEHAATT